MLIAQNQGEQVSEEELHKRKEYLLNEVLPVLNEKLS
jgi:hypothetical protein